MTSAGKVAVSYHPALRPTTGQQHRHQTSVVPIERPVLLQPLNRPAPLHLLPSFLADRRLVSASAEGKYREGSVSALLWVRRCLQPRISGQICFVRE